MNNTYLWETPQVVAHSRYTELFVTYQSLFEGLMIIAIIFLLFGILSIIIMPNYTYTIFALGGFFFAVLLSLIFNNKGPAIYFLLLGLASAVFGEVEKYNKKMKEDATNV